MAVSSATQASGLEQEYYDNYNLQVAKGLVDGVSTVNIYGYQPTVGITFIPLWENATLYTYPVTATQMHLAGSNGDTATILIQGLDANYLAISENVVLNGTSSVTTTKSFLRINSMQVSVGSATNPAGTVTLKDLTDTIIYAQINPSVGRTQAAIYTVPAGYTYYLERVNIYTSLNGNNYAMYQNKTTSAAGVVLLTQQAPFATSYEAKRIIPRPIPEKTDIQLMCKLQSSTGAVSIAQEGYLIRNT